MSKKYKPPPGKCYVSLNKVPEKTIEPHHFNSQVDLLLPQELYSLIEAELFADLPQLTYHVLEMPLSGLLEEAFFNKYIKVGNILMLSKGNIDTENVFSLNDGTLRMVLSKQTYESAGLVGQPSGFWPGRKKQRWIVERDLRSTAMMSGRKSFDRLLWSFNKEFSMPVRFLFCDITQVNDKLEECPILKPFIVKTITPTHLTTPPLRVPSMYPPTRISKRKTSEYDREMWEEWALEINDWLGLARIPAQRLLETDNVDLYLSTYTIDAEYTAALHKVTWRGLIPAQWILKLWEKLSTCLSKQPLSTKTWASLSVTGFENAPISWGNSLHSNITGGENDYTLLILPGAPSVMKELGEGEMEVDGKESRDLVTFEVVGSWDEHS